MSLSLHAPVARDLVALRARSHSAASCCTSPARLPALRNSGRRGALSLRAGPETETEGSPLDFPEEWMKATPSRRPDIFPEFKPLKPQLPQPMPGDPEMPNDEEEEEEKRKKPGEPPEKEKDPDKKENPDENPDEKPEKKEEPAPE